MWRRAPIRLAPALVALVALLSVVGPARAAASSPGRRLHVTVTLSPRQPAALAAYAHAVSTPGSPDYHRYLTPHQFATRFGAGSEAIARVAAALRARGLDPGQTSAGGLSLSLTATAAQLRRAHVATGGLPSATRSVVQSVIGLADNDAAHPLAVRAARRPRRRLIAHAVSTGAAPQACPTVVADAPREGAYTDTEIASAYGFDGLYAAGDEGAGTTIAVYELESDDPSDIAAFQRCYDAHTQVSDVRVDGGAGSGPGSDEAAFDIENLIAFAPRARLLVYQGPNSNSGLPGSGPYDVYSAIINQDRAQVVSVSWGQCEAQLGKAAADAEDELFEQAAVQGQTIVAAAGDNGAEDCDTGGPHSSRNLAVDDPASQPWVTGVGGTTLAALGPPPVERVWNSAASPMTASVGAGGGGVSSLWAMPPYQRDAPASLHVLLRAARGSACHQRGGYCREVPDVSADADPTTGYEVYWNGADTEPEPAGWQALGGTSGAAPLWAALFALADSSPACERSAIGYAGPALYRAAAQDYAADFHDVTAGDNDYTGSHGGDWTAGPGYDLASGLGTPDATPLAASLCADSMRLDPIAGQSSAKGSSVGVQLRVAGLHGPGITFSAGDLPPGVRLHRDSGRLSGRPTKPGRYEVRVGARDGAGARAATTFLWGVGGRPRLVLARLAGGRLSLVVECGSHTPVLRQVAIRLPTDLRTSGRAHVAGGRSRVSGSRSTVVVTPRAATKRVALSVPVAGARAGDRVSVLVRSGTTGRTVLTALVTGG